MTIPRPRRFALFSSLALLALAAAFLRRAPRPLDEFKDLRDAVGAHDASLSAGHASLGEGSGGCVYCHFAHAAKVQRPLWQTQGSVDPAAFMREAERAGGAKTGLCLSCHDGTIAATFKAHSGFGTSASSHDPGSLSNHPVGADYISALRRAPDAYNDPAMNPRIVLEEGKVGCVSCHAAHDAGSVSAGNVRQDICTACHRR